uniref:DJ-1/PfpI domain-containing protein n=1 Tax=Oscillatoriales cyanobacterium SpSt-402 TaxID=2282168 RepID=A0A832M583_9CYAN
MITKTSNQRCILIIIADGFEEIETIVWLSAMRQVGLWVKSVNVTSGLVSGAHGIWLMPDLAFADLDHLLKTTVISLVILPEGEQSLARLEADPRVHKLLRQVVEQGGQIVTGPEGLRIPQVAVVGDTKAGVNGSLHEIVLLRDSAESWEMFVQSIIQRLLQPW